MEDEMETRWLSSSGVLVDVEGYAGLVGDIEGFKVLLWWL